MRLTDELTQQQFRETLDQFHGTEHYYEHRLTNRMRLLLTEGCYFLREYARAWWLFDIITSYQGSGPLKDQEFQVCTLQKQLNGSWVITCMDGNDHALITQTVEYSDFPLENITVWVESGVALLPGEH